MKVEIFNDDEYKRCASIKLFNIELDVYSDYVDFGSADDEDISFATFSIGEVRQFIKALELAIYLVETDITLWQDTFRDHIHSLDLSIRVQNCILRGLGGVNGAWIRREAFSKDGRLLSFDEWCVWIQTPEGKLGLRNLRNFGAKSYKSLIEAVAS